MRKEMVALISHPYKRGEDVRRLLFVAWDRLRPPSHHDQPPPTSILPSHQHASAYAGSQTSVWRDVVYWPCCWVLVAALGGLDAIVELGWGKRWHRSHIPTIGEEMCGGFSSSPGTARDSRKHPPACW